RRGHFEYTARHNGVTIGADDLHRDTRCFPTRRSSDLDPPVASDDIRGPVAEDGSLGFPAAGLTVNDSAGPTNESSQSLTVTAVSAAAHTPDPQALTHVAGPHTPAANNNGPASFDNTVR